MTNWEIVLEGRQGNNDMLNVLHYQGSGAEPVDWQAAADIVRGHLGDHIQSFCSTRVKWVGLTIREDVEGGVGFFVPFTAGDLVGSNETADHADILTGLVRKITNSLVKPTIGWIQQGGLTGGGLTPAGVWDTTITDGVEDFWEDVRILNVVGGSVLSMVVKARNPTAPNTQAYTPVVSLELAGTPRSIRSRFPSSGS